MNLPKNCWYHRRFICFLSMLLSVLLSTKATAQITVEALLKNAVAQVGPEHADVSKAIETFSAGNFLETRELLKSACKV